MPEGLAPASSWRGRRAAARRAAGAGQPAAPAAAEEGEPQPAAPAAAEEGEAPRAERGCWATPAVGSAPDVRVYAAFSLSQPREGVGIYVGEFPEVWQSLCRQRGADAAAWHIRRYKTLNEARAAWQQHHRAAADPPLWLVFR
jgi:hypothetical protein